MEQWMDRRKRLYWYDQYALNDQAAAFARYDPDRIADELVNTGADIIALYAANQFSVTYYPSSIWPQHPNLKGRDYFGDLISRLHARGKKVIAYINWLESRHPEWNMVPLGQEVAECQAELPLVSWADPGNPERRVQNVPGGRWRTPCINSPRREQVVAVAREIAERYHPDALHLDMFFNSSICVCPFCMPELEAICGTTQVTEEAIREHWREFIDWRCERSASLIAEVTAVLREHGVAAVHNAFAPVLQSPVVGVTQDWLGSIDVFLSECFDAFLEPISDVNATSINVRWQHAVGKPAWILRTSTPLHYSHSPISKAQWLLYAAACKANGCKAFGPCGIGAHPDTTSSSRLLANIKDAFDFYMQDADLDESAESIARIAIVFSWATRKYSGRGGNMAWCEEFYGWARLLIEEHLPFDIVVAENVGSSDQLMRYDLVILPDVANLSDGFCDAIRDYVEQGGGVLATAQSSLGTDSGDRREDFKLGELLGVSRQGSTDGPFAIERPDEPWPAFGTMQLVCPSGEVVARRLDVDPAGSVCGMLDPLPVGLSEYPAAVQNAAGLGQSIYVSFGLGRLYSLHGDEHIGLWMAELVDSLLPARQLGAKGPRTVEVTAWRQTEPERTTIHLANRTVAWSLPTDSRQITEIIPVHDFEVSLTSPYPVPTVSCRGAEIEHCMADETVHVRIRQLDAYAAITIEPAP